MFLNPTAEGYLLTNFSTDRVRQANLSQIILDSKHPTSAGEGANVYHQDFIL